MAKFIKLFFLVIFFFLVIPVKAFEFIKSENNPLTINYDFDYSYMLQANIFKKDDQYAGILTAKRPQENYSLLLIESSDGINWSVTKEILNLGFEISNARLLSISGYGKLFLTKTETNGLYKIYSTDCDTSFNCSPNLSLVLEPDINDTTEKNGFFAGFPYLQDSRVYLFYGVWGIDGFKIRLAYSDDGQTWEKCPDKRNLIPGGDGPFVYKDNENLFLFYHRSDSNGIKAAKTNLPLNCDSQFNDQGYVLTKGSSYDVSHMFFPSLVDDNLGLYYTGRAQSGKNSLNYASLAQPTPTPTLMPIILIPGAMASWNKEAILHNKTVNQSDWVLSPFVKEYTGIIQTLKNLGYEENKNFFIFAYDWRKPILEITDDLNNFLTSNPSPSLRANQFSVIGHSLGGLVGRIYLQKFQNGNQNKLITAGSPHQGVTQAYKMVEAGEIDRFNDFLWLAVKTIIGLNRNSLETDKQIINRLFPILEDIFPIYNFLKRDGVEIRIEDMKIKNEVLLNMSHGSNWSNLTAIVGEKGPTLKGYNITDRSLLDRILDNYPDGKPISSYNEIGDYLVLSSSASLNTPVILNMDHGEIIYKKEAIKKILTELNINFQDNQIVEGSATQISPSLIFMIKSPAAMEVMFNGDAYEEEDGIIYIENAQTGDYRLNVKGKEKGKYEVIIGEIGKSTDSWNSINGEISSLIPESETDSYSISFDEENPAEFFIEQDDPTKLLDELISYLKKNKNKIEVKLLENVKKIYLSKTHNIIRYILFNLDKDFVKKNDFVALEKLENIYALIIKKPSQQAKNLASKLESFEKSFQKVLQKLEKHQEKKFDPVILELINKKFSFAKKYLAGKKYSSFEINLESIENLLKKI